MTDGSQAHKTLFCQSFIETHRQFEPADLPWPTLDADSIDRLASIPFWSVALAAERNAGAMVSAYAQTVTDPAIRAALALQGHEEMRHARLLETMLAHYGVVVAERGAPHVACSERAFIDFGYEECIDSFLGMGIFGLARRVQFLIPALTDIFEVVLVEEARHVTFFVNWIAYERIRRGRGSGLFTGFSTALGYGRAVRRMVATFASPVRDGRRSRGVRDASPACSILEDVTWRSFLRSCVDEHERYMRAMPPGLKRPSVLPQLARFALGMPSRRRRAPANAPVRAA
ncbi:MAG: hypothetical protein NVSMB21_24340 [Vulcanimicrobiaceae bacterium]